MKASIMCEIEREREGEKERERGREGYLAPPLGGVLHRSVIWVVVVIAALNRQSL